MTDVVGEADTAAAAPTGGRPSAARERILATVDRLFYAEGIRAVGVHRVVDEAHVTRVTLYRHFPTKDDLVLAYLRRRAAGDRQQVERVIEAYPGRPRAALHELGRQLVETGLGDLHRGCPFINAAAEFAELSHPARRSATEHRVWFTEAMEGLARAAGDPRPASTARMLMMLRTGAVVSAALDGQPAADAQADADFLDAVEQILERVPPDGA